MIYNQYSFQVPEELMLRVITNTDAKNEADDQFAIAHALLSPRFDNVGVIAAHFGDRRGPGSMEASFQECKKIFSLMEFDDSILVRGAAHALPDESTPVPSPGAELIIREAMKDSPWPLFVTFLGPLTDLASAYLIEPRIQDRLTAIWIGGGQYPAGGDEFNLGNDIHAANVVFGSQIPVWQVPKDAYQQMIVSFAELEVRVKPYGPIGDYLFTQLAEFAMNPVARRAPRTGENWMLGDSPVVGLLLCEQRFDYDWVPAPRFLPSMHYQHGQPNRPIRVYKRIDSRFIMEDFYAKLQLFAQKR